MRGQVAGQAHGRQQVAIPDGAVVVGQGLSLLASGGRAARLAAV